MILFRNLLISLVLAASVSASTIVGTILDNTGAPKAGSITIQPQGFPKLLGTNYISGTPFQLTLTNGFFQFSVVQGDYWLLINQTEAPQISVPNDANTYNFVDLINTNGMLYTWKAPGSVVKLDWNDSTFGFLEDKLGFSSPISVATNSLGGNESITVSIPRGTNAVSGYLHSSDWATFTAKQSAIGSTVVTGATVSLNTTNYLQLVVNGVTNKIGIVQ